MPISHVEVEDARASVEQRLDLVSESREVRRVEGRLDLDSADPVMPGHPADSKA